MFAFEKMATQETELTVATRKFIAKGSPLNQAYT